ncbi:TetR/AcrR family transcriptional regulator [Spongiibacter taiwanensis]|uniref:TetR/AcrR family transcriptional regulator n=1 Tax=Spongiibacter taiwanensis TaxID=1748242 RepID=UPI002035E053|nr:TetR/AcrR family transcriptional regulator [Spongiibacter taiwanensis]USA43823.1 TetR/AcrR family transcriptional regulator [Spongiibacter taiwanensis]
MARPRVRERILDAAQQLLQREGVRALTTRNVAQEAGTTEASVFNNFVDKAGLFRSLVDERIPAVHQLRKVIDDRSIETRPWLEALHTQARLYYLEVIPLFSTLLGMSADAEKVKRLGNFDPHAALTLALTRRRLLPIDAGQESAAWMAAMLLGAAMHDSLRNVMAGEKPAGDDLGSEALHFVQTLTSTIRR